VRLVHTAAQGALGFDERRRQLLLAFEIQ
jgi:hypothetical protein